MEENAIKVILVPIVTEIIRITNERIMKSTFHKELN